MSSLSKINSLRFAIIISVLMYFLFFFPLLSSDTYLGGSDADKFFYPSRHYLYESLQNRKFPFWTERILSGFPIYADSEMGYLNPVNILATAIFGPFNSYKVLNLIFYLIGSIAFYLFLRRKGANLLGFVAANAIYYFSFFHLFHIQHFNFVLTTFMIPTGVYLFDTYLIKKKARWLVIHLFLSSLLFYFGSFQSVLLFLFASFLYFSVTAFGHISIVKLSKVFFLYFISLLLLSLPLLLPTIELFFLSSRFYQQIPMLQGSFNPLMVVNMFYPFLFGYGASYKWNMVSGEYFIHETYIYVGFSSLVLGFFGLNFVKDIRLKKYLKLLIVSFFILGFLAYIPILRQLPIPVVSVFRYWGRSIVIFNFAIAVLVALFLSENRKFSMSSFKSSFMFSFGIALYLLLLLVANVTSAATNLTAKIFLAGAFEFNKLFVAWLTIVVLTLFVLYKSLTARENRKQIYRALLTLIVVFDLFSFGFGIGLDYIRNIDNVFFIDRSEELSEFSNQRIAYYSRKNYWSMGLYYPTWGILGYSQYVPASYLNQLKSAKIYDNERLNDQDLFFDSLNDVGVTHMFYYGGILEYEKRPYDLINHFDGEIVEDTRSEGAFSFDIRSNSYQTIRTKIRNYPGWTLTVNGLNESFTNNKEDVYLELDLAEGRYNINIVFVPKIFYIGVLLSLLSLISITMLIKEQRKI